MPRQFLPKVLTANHLLEGDVIYRSQGGGWTRELSQAQLFETEESAEVALKLALLEPQIAVGPYLADAKEGPSGPLPAHFREAFRTRGPSNYFHGKQAEAARV